MSGSYSGMERRQFTRFKVQLPIKCFLSESSAQFNVGFVRDISLGGMLLEVCLPHVEHLASLELDLPQLDKMFICCVSIAWQAPLANIGRTLVGVQFCSLSAQTQQLLEQYLDSLSA